MVKLYVVGGLISGALAGTCPDIMDDPFIQWHENTDPALFQFAKFCGPSTTGSSNATEFREEPEEGYVYAPNLESMCRLKCSNLAKPKYGFVRMRDRDNEGMSVWKRTRTLLCVCQKRKKGKEVCHWKRRPGKAEEKGFRELTADKVPNNAIEISCMEPKCLHAALVSEFNDGTNVGIESDHCPGCVLNNGRDGTWACFDKFDVEVSQADGVPEKGYCLLTCANELVMNPRKKIKCVNPQEAGEPRETKAYLQYHSGGLQKLNKFLYKRMFTKAPMSPDMGWICHSETVDSLERK